MERSLRIDLAYDGTEFVGWQRQSNGTSVQQVVEEALAASCGGRSFAVAGASRTDSGVHALGQVASTRVDTRLDDGTLARAMNAHLPASVAVLDVRTMPDGFHARFWATAKRYVYRVEHGSRRSPLGRQYVAWMPSAPRLGPMREAAASLRGRHDFAGFATAGSPRTTTVRTVRSIHLFRRRRVTTIAVEGDGFLYNQVRAMAGTLLQVGFGQRPPGDVAEILRSRDRRLAGPTAPPEGLVLLRVRIGPGPSRRPEDPDDEGVEGD